MSGQHRSPLAHAMTGRGQQGVDFASTDESDHGRPRRRLLSSPRRGQARGGSTWLLILGVTVVSYGAIVYVTSGAAAAVAIAQFLPLAAILALLGGMVVLYAAAGSAPAMIICLAALVFLNDSSFRERAVQGQLSLDWQNAMKMVLWLVAAAIGLARLPLVKRSQLSPPMLLWAASGVVALVSTAWSPSPLYTFATASGVVAFLLFAPAVTATLTECQILMTWAVTLFLFITAGWAVSLLDPAMGYSVIETDEGGFMERISGIGGQANMLGCLVCLWLGSLFLLWLRGYARAYKLVPFVAFGLATILATGSRTSLLALSIATVGVMASRLWTRILALLAVAGSILLMVVLPSHDVTGLLADLTRSGKTTEVFTLTGRTDIWQFVWDKILLSPWIGHGYNAARVILPKFNGLEDTQISESHSSILETMLSIGVLGAAPVMAAWILLLFQYVRSPSPFRDLFFIFGFIEGLTESYTFGGTPTVTTLTVLLGITLVGSQQAAPGVRLQRLSLTRPTLAANPEKFR